PASERLTDSLVPLLDTDALLAWPGSVPAPGGAPTVCFRLVPPVLIEPERRARVLVDLAEEPPGSAARPADPEPAHARVDSLFLQTGSGRRYPDTRATHPASLNSASGIRLHSAHSARSLEVKACPLRATPGCSSRYLRLLVRS